MKLALFQNVTVGICMCATLVGCAGPTSPFGAINSSLDSANFDEETPISDSPNIRFLPDRQVLHSQSAWKIQVQSPEKIPSDYYFKIFYNSKDVTKIYLNNLNSKVVKNSDQLELSFKNLVLLPNRRNDIVVSFQPSKGQPLVMTRYMPPSCTTDEKLDLRSTARFNPEKEIINWIQKVSLINQTNPTLLAGIVAQESGFDDSAVSLARALGLTQVTPLADQEIADETPNWPRHPKVPELSPLALKWMIQRNIINAENDWRLNPKTSIEGGVIYLNHLMKYWRKPENFSLIQGLSQDPKVAFTAVVIASYNSGPARIKQVLISDGKYWLRNQEIEQARKYVNRVMSYCYHFSKKES